MAGGMSEAAVGDSSPWTHLAELGWDPVSGKADRQGLGRAGVVG